MPKLDPKAYDETQESASAQTFTAFEPGAYVCRIQAVRTKGYDYNGKPVDYVNDKQYIKLILDIAEGPFEGHFSDDYWSGQDKDWGHQVYLSFKPAAYGLLKSWLNCISNSNGGFDARAAFEADKWDMFIGKLVGVQWNQEEYERDGAIKLRVRPDRPYAADAVREGKCPKPRVLLMSPIDGKKWMNADDYRAMRDAEKGAAQPSTSAYDTDEVPF